MRRTTKRAAAPAAQANRTKRSADDADVVSSQEGEDLPPKAKPKKPAARGTKAAKTAAKAATKAATRATATSSSTSAPSDEDEAGAPAESTAMQDADDAEERDLKARLAELQAKKAKASASVVTAKPKAAPRAVDAIDLITTDETYKNELRLQKRMDANEKRFNAISAKVCGPVPLTKKHAMDFNELWDGVGLSYSNEVNHYPELMQPYWLMKLYSGWLQKAANHADTWSIVTIAVKELIKSTKYNVSRWDDDGLVTDLKNDIKTYFGNLEGDTVEQLRLLTEYNPEPDTDFVEILSQFKRLNEKYCEAAKVPSRGSALTNSLFMKLLLNKCGETIRLAVWPSIGNKKGLDPYDVTLTSALRETILNFGPSKPTPRKASDDKPKKRYRSPSPPQATIPAAAATPREDLWCAYHEKMTNHDTKGCRAMRNADRFAGQWQEAQWRKERRPPEQYQQQKPLPPKPALTPAPATPQTKRAVFYKVQPKN